MTTESVFWVAALPDTTAGSPAVLASIFQQDAWLQVFDVAEKGELAEPFTLGVDLYSAAIVGQFDGVGRLDALLLGLQVDAIVGDGPWPPTLAKVEVPPPEQVAVAARGDFNEDGVDDVVTAGPLFIVLLSNP